MRGGVQASKGVQVERLKEVFVDGCWRVHGGQAQNRFKAIKRKKQAAAVNEQRDRKEGPLGPCMREKRQLDDRETIHEWWGGQFIGEATNSEVTIGGCSGSGQGV
ncbi:hypothetical protein GOP47_0004796 [Adiantum capillus-veneris]|uniref:Uncharacterized protein n=1 Tax=Adiantum capillus-veneris TaxID=13818 RepID=A0A9D4V5I3_ADICA|nr:hypothetical protein GOP47_0004796 [Adiantum capillus-veneris]